MVEKLKGIEHDNGAFTTTELSASNSELFQKINELIEIVNALVEENNIHEKQIDELQMKLEPEKCEIPVDPFAEQRRWIGKLCKFWDGNFEEDGFYDVLGDIKEYNEFPYVREGGYVGYKHCEPASEDIIYKGE